YVYWGNWCIYLLPYVEQDNLFKLYNDTVQNIDPANATVRLTFLSVYTCPSDINANKTMVPETGANAGSNNGVPYMTGSYRGMSGISTTGFDQWAGYPSEGAVNLKNNTSLRAV